MWLYQGMAPTGVRERWSHLSQNPKWFGLEETLKLLSSPPCQGQGHFHCSRVLQALSSLPWTCTRITSRPSSSQITHSSPYLRQTTANTSELSSRLQRRSRHRSEVALAIHKDGDLAGPSHGSAPSPSPGAVPSAV